MHLIALEVSTNCSFRIYFHGIQLHNLKYAKIMLA